MHTRAILALTLACSFYATALADDPAKVGFHDDFIGKPDPAWKILNENAENISYTKHPGLLTITTEVGSMSEFRDSCKNIFVIDSPLKPEEGFVITTRIFGFEPTQNFHQAGILCMDNSDDYVSFTFEYDGGQGGPSLCTTHEIAGEVKVNLSIPVKGPLPEVWLRLVRSDAKYYYFVSRDGEKYQLIRTVDWKEGKGEQLGIMANSASLQANSIEANFDEFEFAPLELKPEVKEDLKLEPYAEKSY